MVRQRSTASPLALAYLLLIVYASLYPFEGWRWPAVQTPFDLLALPWPKIHRPSTIGRICSAMPPWAPCCSWRSRATMVATWKALAAGALVPALLSYAVETTQSFVPGRVPSLRDWALNSARCAERQRAGAAARRMGIVRPLAARARALVHARQRPAPGAVAAVAGGAAVSDAGALGSGPGVRRTAHLVEAAFAGTPWAADVQAWLGPCPAPSRALSAGREALPSGWAAGAWLAGVRRHAPGLAPRLQPPRCRAGCAGCHDPVDGTQLRPGSRAGVADAATRCRPLAAPRCWRC